jgi:3-deoxy-manno-octulosonate cytidylyltransferase (CMP-KDO synthetase)
MIVRVLDRARACPGLDRIVVATDSEEIKNTVESCGGEAWLTSPLHRTGSDRVAEVAERLPQELILNLQGDEPLLPASTVEALVRFGRSCAELTVVTAAIPLLREADVVNPNIVKVVADISGRALYFSRCPVPYRKSAPLALSAASRSAACEGYFKHIGIYLYRKDFLLKYVRLSSGPLEISEALEQLRILEHGFPIFVVRVDEDSVSVDTEEDLAEVEGILERQHGNSG